MEESIFEFETLPVLPPESRRTLLMLAREETRCLNFILGGEALWSNAQRVYNYIMYDLEMQSTLNATRCLAAHMGAINTDPRVPFIDRYSHN